MRKLCLLFIITCILTTFSGCRKSSSESNFFWLQTPSCRLVATVTKNDLEPIYDGIILFREGNYCGIMDNYGRTLIPANYCGLYPLSESYYKFQKRDEYGCAGVLDNKGNEVIPGQYDNFIYINEEYILAKNIDIDKYEKTGQVDASYYLLSLPDGKLIKQLEKNVIMVSKAVIVEDILEIHGNIQIGEDNVPYHAYDINTWNEYEISRSYLNIISSYYIDVITDKEEVTERWDEAEDWDESYRDILGDSRTYTNITSEILSAKGEVVSTAYSLTDSPVYKDEPIPVWNKSTKEYCYINSSGEVIIENNYEWVSSFKNRETAIVIKNGYWGLIDKQGNPLTEFIYDQIYAWENGFYVARIKDSYGIINEKGVITVPVSIQDESITSDFQYTGIITCAEGQYTVNPNNGERSMYYHIIDRTNDQNTIFIPREKDDSGAYKEGLLIYERLVVDCKYDRMYLSKDGKIAVGENGSTYDIYKIDF